MKQHHSEAQANNINNCNKPSRCVGLLKGCVKDLLCAKWFVRGSGARGRARAEGECKEELVGVSAKRGVQKE